MAHELIRAAPLLIPMAVAALAVSAQSGGTDEPAAKVRLIADHSTVTPSQTVWLAVEFKIDEKWHIYWPGQNDSGYAPNIEWSLPEGVLAGEMLWPAPKRYVLPGRILDHTLEDEVLLLTPIIIESAKPGDVVRISAHVEWLECEEGCVQRERDVTITLRVADAAVPSDDAAAIERGRAQIPKPSEGVVVTDWESAGNVTIGVVPPPGRTVARVAFYPHESGAKVSNPLDTCEAPRGFLAAIPVDPDPDKPVRGVVEAWDAEGVSLGRWWLDNPSHVDQGSTAKGKR